MSNTLFQCFKVVPCLLRVFHWLFKDIYLFFFMTMTNRCFKGGLVSFCKYEFTWAAAMTVVKKKVTKLDITTLENP